MSGVAQANAGQTSLIADVLHDGNALVFAPMQLDDVDAVLAIEESVYSSPWSRTNFTDSLQSSYPAWVVRDAHHIIVGYVLVMCAPYETHLLNIAVHPDAQQRGVGRILMDKAVAIARGAQAEVMILEVRPSNQRALHIYRRYGFVQTRVRKDYYPAQNGAREDAIEMSLTL